MNETNQPLPRARKSQLIMKEVAGEMLVYDRDSDEAHCLNPTAAFIWTHCDGRTSVTKMTQLLEDEMRTPCADEVVWFALEQLRKSNLLEKSYARPPQIEHLSRRALVMRLGVAAAVTVPFIRSITAPTAAQAATCGANGAPCINNAQCCSNNCVDNGRGGFQCA
jgi:hypothetical protein